MAEYLAIQINKNFLTYEVVINKFTGLKNDIDLQLIELKNN